MTAMYKSHKKFMEAAIKVAKRHVGRNELIIGAVIVKDGRIIAKSGNRARIDKDPSAHAEIVVIRKACKKLDSKYLRGCVLYSTNEPCAMCSSACVLAELDGIVFGANVEDMRKYWMEEIGESESEYKNIDIPCSEVLKRSNPKLFVVKNFMREECKKLFELY